MFTTMSVSPAGASGQGSDRVSHGASGMVLASTPAKPCAAHLRCRRRRPEGYWVWFSDYVIGRIHMRVLQHIEAEVEGPPG